MDDTIFCFACFASITLSSRAAMILANLPPSSRVTLWILRSFHLLKGLHQLKCLISQYSHWTWLLGAAGRLEKKPMQLPYVGAQKTPEMHCIGTAYYIYAWYRPDRTRRWHCARSLPFGNRRWRDTHRHKHTHAHTHTRTHTHAQTRMQQTIRNLLLILAWHDTVLLWGVQYTLAACISFGAFKQIIVFLMSFFAMQFDAQTCRRFTVAICTCVSSILVASRSVSSGVPIKPYMFYVGLCWAHVGPRWPLLRLCWTYIRPVLRHVGPCGAYVGAMVNLLGL